MLKELKACVNNCLDAINRQKGTQLRLGDIQWSYMGKAIGILDDKAGGGFDVHVNHENLQKMYNRNPLYAQKILLEKIWEEYKKYKQTLPDEQDKQITMAIDQKQFDAVVKMMRDITEQQNKLVDAQEKLNDLETILTTMSQTVYKD